MKIRTIVIISGIFFVLITALLYSSSINVFTIKRSAGISFESKNHGLGPVIDDGSQFSKTVKALNEGWELIRLGNSYDSAGQYEDALKAYKRAYEVDPGNRVFIGDKLIEAYEKVFRYDEAIAVVDEILKTQPLVEYGIDEFTKIRTRLLAAKAKSLNQTPSELSL